MPGYNESVPMTDQSLPGRQFAAAWSSGDPTIATSGGGFVYGKGLGAYNGTFAVAALKAQRVLFLTLSRSGKLQRVHVPGRAAAVRPDPHRRRRARIASSTSPPTTAAATTRSSGCGRAAELRAAWAGRAC